MGLYSGLLMFLLVMSPYHLNITIIILFIVINSVCERERLCEICQKDQVCCFSCGCCSCWCVLPKTSLISYPALTSITDHHHHTLINYVHHLVSSLRVYKLYVSPFPMGVCACVCLGCPYLRP